MAASVIHCNKGHLYSTGSYKLRMRRSGPYEGEVWRECLLCKQERNQVAVLTGANRIASLKFRYNIDEVTVEALWEKQLGLCAICCRSMHRLIIDKNKGSRSSAHIDHDHVSGKVRGLLCGNCNIGLGNLGDNIEVLNRAIEYLVKFRAQEK